MYVVKYTATESDVIIFMSVFDRVCDKIVYVCIYAIQVFILSST